MLLTNIEMKRNRKSLWWEVSAYPTCWRIEETIRFIKQSYDLVDIRMLSYRRLRSLVVPVDAVAFFTVSVIGTRMKLSILAAHLVTASKRLLGIPGFRRCERRRNPRGLRSLTGRIARPPEQIPNLCPGSAEIVGKVLASEPLARKPGVRHISAVKPCPTWSARWQPIPIIPPPR